MGDKNPAIDESYILTPSVKLNLRDLVRVVSAGYEDNILFCVLYTKILLIALNLGFHTILLSSLVLAYGGFRQETDSP